MCYSGALFDTSLIKSDIVSNRAPVNTQTLDITTVDISQLLSGALFDTMSDLYRVSVCYLRGSV